MSRDRGVGSLMLRVDLPVQLGLRKKFKSCPKNAQNLCRHILGSFPQKLCGNCAAQILHNLCTFFDAPAHVSHKFSGTSRDYPAHKFCTIFSDTWHVLRICLCTGKSCLNTNGKYIQMNEVGVCLCVVLCVCCLSKATTLGQLQEHRRKVPRPRPKRHLTFVSPSLP